MPVFECCNFDAMKEKLYITKKRPCNIQRFFGCKNENFPWKKFDLFLIFAQNVDCGYTLEPPRRGGSNEYPQSMFWSKNKKNSYTPAKPSFFLYESKYKGVYISRTCFPDEYEEHRPQGNLYFFSICRYAK